MNELDLHGFNHDEAIRATEDFLINESLTSSVISCSIITGHSKKLQDKIIIEVLDRLDFKWYIPSWNTGQIIIG
tara:strand:+ start:17601 stop:17822 length:222 start_codon:yes stop_codon:yes gene_type:complete